MSNNTTLLSGREIIERAESLSDFLIEHDAANEELTRLAPEVKAALVETGVIRGLQPKRFQGYEISGADFARAVIALGSRSGSAGWVAQIVGVHAHELAVGSLRMQEEIWGDDPDTWVASPYAPTGLAKPVDGGFMFSGRWSFSTGTDHCTWVMIGGKVADADGAPTGEVRHFVLPRKDYEIVQDSWDVIGLSGSGSRDLVVRDVFVPDYRTIKVDERSWYRGVEENELTDPLYSIPRSIMFGTAITAGTIAMAKGVLDEYVRHSIARAGQVHPNTGESKSLDLHKLRLLGEAASDIESAIAGFISGLEQAYDLAATTGTVPLETRVALKRDRLRGARRAVDAADRLFFTAGGESLRRGHHLQRMWRDMHAGANHASNQGLENALTDGGRAVMGLEVSPLAQTF